MIRPTVRIEPHIDGSNLRGVHSDASRIASQVQRAAMDEVTIAIWFGSAVFIAVVENFAFYLYLLSVGAKPIFSLAGTPGYLDYVYYNFRKEQNRSSFLVIIVRALLLANAVAAAFVFAFTIK